jgi:GDP-L-fucose synthase
MKILITGGNGYVGKSLYGALKDKHEIAIITRDKCDLTDPSSVNYYFLDTWFDVVIHCAIKGGSRLQQDNWNIMDVNLSMYYNLINNKDHFGKLIYFGSGAELYDSNSPYGLSKYVIKQSILNRDNFYNLRIFGVFDENELDTRFIKANIKRYINKEPIHIDQDKHMTFFYMKDLVKLVEYYILNNNLPKEIDCCYTNNSSLKNISDFINTLSEYKVDINIINKELGVDYIGKIQPSFTSINFIGLEQGIKEIYNKLK